MSSPYFLAKVLYLFGLELDFRCKVFILLEQWSKVFILMGLDPALKKARHSPGPFGFPSSSILPIGIKLMGTFLVVRKPLSYRQLNAFSQIGALDRKMLWSGRRKSWVATANVIAKGGQSRMYLSETAYGRRKV